jgi:hypothetical protein
MAASSSSDSAHKYSELPQSSHGESDRDPLEDLENHLRSARLARRRRKPLVMGLSVLGVMLFAYWTIS